MSVANFNDLMQHVGHDIVVVHYGGVNVATECETCGEVLQDFNRDEEEAPLWENDTIQFARLLAEINACCEISEPNMNELLESMDLSIKNVHEIFDRADKEWEKSKRDNCPKTS